MEGILLITIPHVKSDEAGLVSPKIEIEGNGNNECLVIVVDSKKTTVKMTPANKNETIGKCLTNKRVDIGPIRFVFLISIRCSA
jgi:hypothetical protein